MQFEFSQLISLASLIISLGVIVWKSGAQDMKLNQLLAGVAKLEANASKTETDTDTRFAATQAQISLIQSQIADVREKLAGDYMRKPEINQIETRVMDKQREIVDSIKEINHKVDKLLSRPGA